MGILVVAVIIEVALILIFHVPVSVINIINIVLLIILGILFLTASGQPDYEKDKYGLSKISTPDRWKAMGIIYAFCALVIGIYMSIVYMIFDHVGFSDGFSVLPDYILIGVIGGLIMTVILMWIYAFKEKEYKAKYERMVELEKEAHERYDSSIYEAIEKANVMSVKTAQKEIASYCREQAKFDQKCGQFLDFDFFIKDGLEIYTSSNDIITKGDYYVAASALKKAHSVWDPKMLEYIEENGEGSCLVSREQILKFCKDNVQTQYKKFLDYSFFLADGLDVLVKAGKVDSLQPDKRKSLILYRPKTQHDIRDEIEI